MTSLVEHLPYLGVVVLLLAGGMGLPLPEDVPLLASGYLCHLGKADIHIMVPVAVVSVLAGDFIMFSLGRRHGHHVSKLPLLNRYLTPDRFAQVVAAFEKHGGKTLFVGRFLPGLRAAVFFSAGTFRVRAAKMLVYDGAAALISVPTLVLLAYFGGNQIDRVRAFAKDAQLAALGILVLAIAGYVVAKRVWKKRAADRVVAEAGSPKLEVATEPERSAVDGE